MGARFWLTVGVAAIAVATGCTVELPATVATTAAGVGKAKPKASSKPSPKATSAPDGEPSDDASDPDAEPSHDAPADDAPADEASAAPATSPPPRPGAASEPPTVATTVAPASPVAAPAIVEWSKLEPSNGITVSVVSTRTTDDSGQAFVETTITYKPDPPDVTVTLKAPPGSPGTTIAGYELSFEYTTPNLQAAGKPPAVVGPTAVPIAPVVVPAGPELAFGEPVELVLPIGSRTLTDIFSGGKDDQPGLVVATVGFKDANGFPVLGKDLNPLKVSVPLRAL